MRSTYLVCYDIRDDKRLRRVFKTMKDWGDHLQYSVFECQFTPIDLARCRHELSEIINHAHDQVLFIDLGPTELGVIVVTATLAAVGAAGIPSAGLVTMVIVVEAVNNSLGLEGKSALPLASVGIIIGVDRILDMCRTTVNVWGDAVGAKIITRIAPDAA